MSVTLPHEQYKTMTELLWLQRRGDQYQAQLTLPSFAVNADAPDGIRTRFRAFLVACEAREYDPLVDRRQILGQVKAMREAYGLDR
jgi:hypothetical protein